ncbi:hypothetical protein TNCV_242261 [Trichonephila clavipes]|uniref:Uncharacterized protein n=1 Tax=Trichonephila clavipes TaxID=2585209 RepID=A0A8X6W469_TRICX|nr:hypothetical protein TNCV_242261 [Trichonephila clavipes]
MCSIGDRSGDLAGQGNMPKLCREGCVTNAIYPKRKKKSELMSGKRVGQSPLEITRSSKNSVKTSILLRDV